MRSHLLKLDDPLIGPAKVFCFEGPGLHWSSVTKLPLVSYPYRKFCSKLVCMSAFNIFRLVGDLLHVASILLLWQKIQKTKSCSGISLKSQLLFLAVYICRYLDLFVFLFHGNLAFKHFYNFLMKCLFIGSESAVVYFMWYRFRASYNAKLDSVRVELILLPCFVLAFFFLHANPRGGTMYFVREVLLVSLKLASLTVW